MVLTEEIILDGKEEKKQGDCVNYTASVTFEVVSAVVLPQLLFLPLFCHYLRKDCCLINNVQHWMPDESIAKRLDYIIKGERRKDALRMGLLQVTR